MSDSMLEAAYHLTQAGKPYVLATVVWCERPTSAKPGAQAIIQEDGRLLGWVGGSCTQPIVTREARRLLREGGEALLLRLGTTAQSAQTESASVRYFPMTCASGGALDIYMEPHLPKPQLLLIGDSPIIAALQRLAPVLDFAVTQLDDANVSAANIDERTSVVIATHGQYDENVLERVLVSSAAYIGMVSSIRRAEACRAYLREAGLTTQQIARLHAPSGLNIGARTPAEIAASILAELIQERRRMSEPTSNTTPDKNQAATMEEQSTQSAEHPGEMTAIDPVCGMSVETAEAHHTSSYAGRTYYFCCSACKRQFERDPERFLLKKEG